jgi:hypothetical protein
MAIINMGWHSSVFEGNVKLLEGAYSPIHRNDIGGDYPPSYFLYETDHGCCIKERERNGYHDSDFEMLIWNPETKKRFMVYICNYPWLVLSMLWFTPRCNTRSFRSI